LKYRRRVRQPKGHDQELEQPLMCVEGRHVDIVRVHLHLVISRPWVELGEGGAAEFIEQFLYDRNQELVLDSALIQGSVVDADPP
jgi:hypothetical protein